MMLVMQRTDCDCGCAAVASLCGVSYEVAESAWVRALGRKPHASRYWHLLAVIKELGHDGKKINNAPVCIRRVREKPRDKHSHWVVLVDEGLWCPTLGWFPLKTDYPWQAFGRGIALR